ANAQLCVSHTNATRNVCGCANLHPILSHTSARLVYFYRKNKLPATSVRSVGGMKACAASRCGRYERLKFSGAGNRKPWSLLNGSSDNAAKREFHIRFG